VRVAFDSQIFSIQRRGGVSRYFVSLARALGSLGCEPRLLTFLASNDHALDLAADLLPTGHVDLRDGRLPKRRLSHEAVRATNRALAKAWIAARSPDVVHETYFFARLPRMPGQRTVLTVFDMTAELHPEGIPPAEAEAKRRAVDRADRVLCISENTRRDLLRLYGTDPAKVTVTPLGVDLPPPPAEPSPPTDRPYLLFVGQRGLYKNFDALLEAYAASPRLRGLDLLCFGGAPWSAEEAARAARLGVPAARVRQSSGDDHALAAAYRGAVALVYPSRYEGFGLPPLEAMSQGCPVVCSDTSSLPEVVGDAALTVASDDVDALRSAVERVVDDEALRADLAIRGRARAATFTWERCAQQTLEVYRSLR
jgi:glycosyltransferase involved in cell wall biosynthesis